MRTDKELGLKLRLEGKSYREIRKILGISISTLSGWFKDHEGSKLVFETLMKRHKGLSREKLFKMHDARREIARADEAKIRRQAQEEFLMLKHNPLFVAGVFIYSGEGTKVSKYKVAVSNTDPAVIAIFRNFLLHICKVEEHKIKSWLLLYPDLVDEHVRRYWIATTGLNSASFTKSVIIQGRHKKKRLDFGVCTIGLGSKSLKLKIMLWIDLMSKELLLNKAGIV